MNHTCQAFASKPEHRRDSCPVDMYLTWPPSSSVFRTCTAFIPGLALHDTMSAGVGGSGSGTSSALSVRRWPDQRWEREPPCGDSRCPPSMPESSLRRHIGRCEQRKEKGEAGCCSRTRPSFQPKSHLSVLIQPHVIQGKNEIRRQVMHGKV